MHGSRQDDIEQDAASATLSQHAEELSDETLIHAIAIGAIWAIETLYQRYNRILYSFAYRMVSDHQIAEDLLQESFLSIWRRSSSYSPQLGGVRSWLFSIIHHRTIDYLRSVRRRSPLPSVTLDEVELGGDPATIAPDVWDEVWRSVKSARVREALVKLSPEQRMVIELAYFQGWTHTEIAEGCQIPLGTVKARMRLGLMHLKRTLEQMGVMEQ